MLTTIQRKIAVDILVMFAISLTVITALVMFIGVAREAIHQGLGPLGVARLIPFAIPNALALTIPGTALFSVCSIYGRMSADNELTAMQSVGISPTSAILPSIAITFLLSLSAVVMINVAFTWGFRGIEQVVISSVEQVAYRVLKRDRCFSRDKFSLTVRDVIDKELIDPTIKIRQSNGRQLIVRGRSAVLDYNDEEQALQLSITDGYAKMGDTAAFRFPDTFVQTIPLRDNHQRDLLSANPSHIRMRDLPAASLRQTTDVQRRECEVAVRLGFDLLNSRSENLVNAEADQRADALTNSRRRLHRLAAEMQRRWASGFTCLALAMVGIPIGVRLRTSDTMTTFGIAFLPILIVYYPIFALTLDLAKSGQIAVQGVWIANLVFIALGLLMMRRTFRPRR